MGREPYELPRPLSQIQIWFFEKMGYFAVKLDPGKLTNPDLGIRLDLPDLLEEASDGQITDSGFEYDEGDTLVVYLHCDDPDRHVSTVINVLSKTEVCGNRLLDSAVIGVSKEGPKFRIIHPPTQSGEFVVERW